MRNSFRYFKTSPEIIRLAVMMYVRFPLSLRQVEDLLHERGIDICHETGGTGSGGFVKLTGFTTKSRQIDDGCYMQFQCLGLMEKCRK